MSWSYDFYTDIINFTGNPDLDTDLMDWAINEAVTYYIADDPSNYDDTISDLDNRLIAMLAAAFVLANFTGTVFTVNFTANVNTIKLDEFEVANSNPNESINASDKRVKGAFELFFRWLNSYLSRGITLQYVDKGIALITTTYDPTIYLVDKTPPTGAL